MTKTEKIKVFLPCTGLGHVQRGYESFTRQCFDNLSNSDVFDLYLFKGSGKSSKREISLFTLPREQWTTRQIGRGLGRFTGNGGGYFTEQLSFFMSFIFHINWHNPDVIFFSDERLGDLLWRWKNITGKSFKLLFSNGGPTSRFNNLSRWDHIHQIAPTHYQIALEHCISAQKQTLIPCACGISKTINLPSANDKVAIRNRLDLPQERPIILSVCAINKSHKRVDYLIKELAALPEPRPYLVVLGHRDSESPPILQMASDLLGKGNFRMTTVAHSEIEIYYKVADLFVLPSVREGLGRVLIEAMSYGLPCLAHDYEIARYALGEEGYFSNFDAPGELSRLFSKVLSDQSIYDGSRRINRHRFAFDNFSWEKATPKYIEMISNCVKDDRSSLAYSQK